ncbi:SDR family oxidoreductase [Cochlodiniinecator piscidefendens]|uniref:SDR family oxidoreductase n=1 Tax=Cochlodiniinecator piscidefendens TaxID=2715756 RepID=UPI00140A522F|nr:SDR family oxidoreductase [Cochlodiniinecator piscidefendens]
MTEKVLLLGADGFIGRHIAFGLRTRGYHVLASARRTNRLSEMGFDTLQADLTAPETHRSDFWKPHLQDVKFVVNCAGLLTGSHTVFDAVHAKAPDAIYGALPEGARGVLLSAVGIDADTKFSHYRKLGESIAIKHNITILRAGLVMADTSYGGSSLLRGLASLPFATPVIGTGEQQLNPIHADDLCEVIHRCFSVNLAPQPHDIGGPEYVSQSALIAKLRGWMGLPKTRVFKTPDTIARLVGRLGDFCKLGPISTIALDQFKSGVTANHSPLCDKLDYTPRGVSAFLNARPAGTQDVWHARLYLLRPILRFTLAFMWFISGLLGLFLPSQAFLPLLSEAPFSDTTLIFLARGGGCVDLLISAALIRGFALRKITWLQIGMVAGYTIGITLLSPMLWLLPIGGLLKNLPILVLLTLYMILEDER